MTELKLENELPSKKLVVSEEAVPFISRGGRIFSNQVIEADPEIQEGEIVRVVDRKGRVLTIAQAVFTPEELARIRQVRISS
jgi:uncharacterized protein with predicted RNA binding PUA domain